MDMISDTLMIAGTLGVALYCAILARRLRKFATLESGMGAAIAVLSAQVDDLTRMLERARSAAAGSAGTLEALTTRAETVAARLDVMLAVMHDFPADPIPPLAPEIAEARRPRFIRRRAPREDLEAAE